MAWVIGDGFDLYNVAADVSNSGLWDPASVPNGLTTGRFGNSRAYSAAVFGQFPQLVKTSGSNDATHHLVFAYQFVATPTPTAGRGLYFVFYDGTLAQCSIMLETATGNLLFYSGALGTLLGTFSGSPIAVNTWYGIEIEVTIHNTAGAFHVRLNGNTADDYVLTNVNTRAGSANAYANKIQMGTNANIGTGPAKLDDFLWFTTSGAAPNTWVGDIRCETKMPISTASAGLTAPSPYVLQPNGAMGGTTNWTGAHIVSTAPITSAAGGTLSSLTIHNGTTAYTGKWKLAIYDGTSGSLGALLAQTAEQTNMASNSDITVSLIAPLTITLGQKLFGAILTDSNITSLGYVTTGTALIYTATIVYASGFPSNFGNPTPNQAIGLWAAMNFSVTDNASFVSEVQTDADATFLSSTTVGANDFYNLQQLNSTPVSILAVQTRLSSRKSDTAARQARVQVKSGATTSNGSNFSMSSSYTYANKVDVTDPNGGVAWTPTAVNNFQVGAYLVA